MSELRDHAAVLRAIHQSLTSIENHVANQDGHLEQMRLGLHDLRDTIHMKDSVADLQMKGLKQIQVWMGDFSTTMATLKTMVESLQASVTQGFRDDRRRLRALEGSAEETTQT